MTIEKDHTMAYTETGKGSTKDIPLDLEDFEINWSPYWGSFYYFVKGQINFLHDTAADRTDACNDYACDQNQVPNYCDRDVKLFTGGSDFSIFSV